MLSAAKHLDPPKTLRCAQSDYIKGVMNNSGVSPILSGDTPQKLHIDHYCHLAMSPAYGVAITLTLSNRPPSEAVLNCHRNRTAKFGLLLAAAGQLIVRVDQTFCVMLKALTASSNVHGPPVPAVL